MRYIVVDKEMYREEELTAGMGFCSQCALRNAEEVRCMHPSFCPPKAYYVHVSHYSDEFVLAKLRGELE